jgi:uncharacterized protein DUF6869
VSARPTRADLTVVRGPIDLPLARHHIARVGIGRRSVSLAVRPTDDLRRQGYDIDLSGPFSIARSPIDVPAAIAARLDALVEMGIVSARATADDGLELELITGDVVAAKAGRWSVEAADGRRWEAQPAGGIAMWSTTGEGPTPPLDDDRDEWEARKPDDQPVDIGPGLDLPGAGLQLTDVQVSVDGSLSLTFRSIGAGSPASARKAYDRPDVMQAVEFFTTLRVGPGTVPPDAEVFAAMQGAISRADLGLGRAVWVDLDAVEPSLSESASVILSALGSGAASIHVVPGGMLHVEVQDGPRFRSTSWWLRTSDFEHWFGTDAGFVRHRVGRGLPALRASQALELAEAWLDYDRTGHPSRAWAWERVNDVVSHQPMTGWLVVRNLIARAADEAQLGSVAAGPLEELLAAHSAVLIDRVEAAASSDPRTMQALAGVWKNAIADDDWERIQRVVGRGDG